MTTELPTMVEPRPTPIQMPVVVEVVTEAVSVLVSFDHWTSTPPIVWQVPMCKEQPRAHTDRLAAKSATLLNKRSYLCKRRWRPARSRQKRGSKASALRCNAQRTRLKTSQFALVKRLFIAHYI